MIEKIIKFLIKFTRYKKEKNIFNEAEEIKKH